MDFDRWHCVPGLSSEWGAHRIAQKKIAVKTYFPLNVLENARIFPCICNKNKYVYQKKGASVVEQKTMWSISYYRVDLARDFDFRGLQQSLAF